MNRRTFPLATCLLALLCLAGLTVAAADERKAGGGEAADDGGQLTGQGVNDTLLFKENMHTLDFRPYGQFSWATSQGAARRNADVDGDGDVDLIVGADLYIAEGEGSFLLYSQAAELGATLTPVDQVLRRQLNLPDDQGLVVAKIVPKMRLAKAGLRDDDIILQVNQQPVSDAAQLKKTLSSGKGRRATIKFVRRGEEQSTTLENPWKVITFETPKQYRIGVSVSPTDRTVQSHLHLPEGEGLIVTEVIDETPAAKVGIEKHDVLLKVGDQVLQTVEDLRGAVRDSKGKTLSVHLIRSGKKLTKRVKPELVEQPRSYVTWVGGYDDWYDDGLQRTYLDFDNRAVIKEFDLASGAAIASEPEIKQPTPDGDKLDKVLQQLDQLRKEVQSLRKNLSDKSDK